MAEVCVMFQTLGDAWPIAFHFNINLLKSSSRKFYCLLTILAILSIE